MEIRICIPSYKRAEYCRILDYLPFAVIYVCESEAKEYRKKNKKAMIHAMPRGVQGHLSRVRNYILKKNNDADAVIMMDDDVRHVQGFEEGKIFTVETKDFNSWIQHNTLLAKELGAKVWGININTDKQCYREYTPFSFKSVIMGHFMCYLMPIELKYDSRFTLKDDYDFCLQVLNKHRKILRFNKYSVDCGAAWSGSGLPGGCCTLRNKITEYNEFEFLAKKWGTAIVNIDRNDRSHSSTKKKTFDYNPVVRVPIKGI